MANGAICAICEEWNDLRDMRDLIASVINGTFGMIERSGSLKAGETCLIRLGQPEIGKSLVLESYSNLNEKLGKNHMHTQMALARIGKFLKLYRR